MWVKHFLCPIPTSIRGYLLIALIGGTYLLPLLTTLPRRHVLGNLRFRYLGFSETYLVTQLVSAA